MPHQYAWQLLRAGSLRLDGGGMFGVVPKVMWAQIAPPDESNRIPLQTNCLLLNDREGTRVLIETGFGDKWSDKDRGYYDLERRCILHALQEIGVEPESIDHVVVTHLHFDHAGGLTRLDETGEPVSTFPRATIHVQRTEWEDALANKSIMTRTYLESHLQPIAHQLQLHDGEEEIFDGSNIHVRPMPGHTWGHQAVSFEDDEGVLIFPGDVMPTQNHIGLAFSMGYDVEPYTNMLSKRRLLKDAGAHGWRIIFDHEPSDSVMTVPPCE